MIVLTADDAAAASEISSSGEEDVLPVARPREIVPTTVDLVHPEVIMDPKPRILCTLWYLVKWNNCKCRWESPLDGHRIISRSASTTTYE
jgi:hypothetical protein